jgi:hypothetical protein
MPYYIPDLVSKTTCIGNTLSTFNTSFSNLDTRLFQLSTYTVNSVNFLSSTMISVSSVLNSRINFLSSAMISVSSDLRTQINTTSSDLRTQINTTSSDLKTQINYISANVVEDYITQGVLNPVGDQVNWNFSTVGNNAKINLSSDVRLNNPTGLLTGQTGNLIVQIDTINSSITSFGNLWLFGGGFSSLEVTLSAKNIISYYYDGEYLLSNLISFTFD